MQHFRIALEGKSYQVTVEDLDSDQVRVTVDGELFDVSVEALEGAPAQDAVSEDKSRPPLAERLVKAPMPGTINKVNVKPGERVEYGQELCVLEAMKMNNVIRATGAGRVAEVRVTAKQSVQHGDVLIVFDDEM